MKKIHYKIVIIMLFVGIMLFFNRSICNAGTAGISASSKDVKVGDSVNINVSINAIAWNLKVSGSGVSDTIVGGNLDELANKSTSKSYKLDTSNPGTYTVSLSGDVTDANGTPSNISDSVTVKVSEKSNTNPSGNGETTNGGASNNNGTTGNNDDKPKEPTFNTVSQTVYATQDGINIRSSYSTSSSSIGKLKKGEEVTRIGVGSNGWSKVNYNGTTAYISSSLLTTTKPEEEKSTVKALKSLTVEPGTLSPEFDPETTKYTMTVGTDVTKLNINAVVEDEKSKLDISGNEDLELGENIIKLVVTAEDETARTYTITVTKEEQEQLKLDTLSIKGIDLNPSFSSDVYEYTANVDNNITKLDIEAICNIENATIEILGNEDLQDGENTVTIMLKSEDGKQNVTYQIIVKKAVKTIASSNVSEGSNSNMQYIIVGSILGGILLIIIIVLVVKKIRNNREDDGIELNFMDDIKMMDNNDNELENNKQNEEDNQEENREDEYIMMEEQSKTKPNKLYNVEDEVDFSDVEQEPKRRKKGKHF